MNSPIHFPGLGDFAPPCGLLFREACSDGWHRVGQDGVQAIAATRDGAAEFIALAGHTLAYVKSALGYPAYYPVRPVSLETPARAVLMDLDGTSVHSEHFWIWIIQQTVASLLDNPRFELEQADLPHVSGHSVSQHLAYCLRKYCPDKSVEDARRWYFQHTHREMAAINEGRGRPNAFDPAPGLKDFLLALKGRGIKIALVTSGLYEKAYPEILSVFQTLRMGRPEDFYDAIITAGFPLRRGEVGTLGELTPKPHPWLYAEACRVGLGIPVEDSSQVVGIEDSGAGVCSIRLAGYSAIGMAGGNIVESGLLPLCRDYCARFEEVLETIA
jgi:beta-phosphoglucomutase-like phosphatase (HAD superfamily)